ncbi:hypothetical protein MNBD_NITROSPINAE01-556 [hydrothermal vent metagenome]|uniref:Leucine-binding protein domain-containing protein n=1 Tax=hydrothermal vent metagenome TaxID=652676 RepID=A0A3B1CDL3_9ZZZZ
MTNEIGAVWKKPGTRTHSRLAEIFVKAAVIIILVPTLFSCATLPEPGRVPEELPVVAPAREKTAGPSAYRKADRLFNSGQYKKAAKAFTQFIGEIRPNDPLIDNAYFKIGLSWFKLERFRDALHYFEIVTNRFPVSEVYTDALINAGICNFHLKDNKKAEQFFEKALPLAGLTSQKTNIFFYKASIEEQNGGFEKAAELYIKSEAVANTDQLIRTAKNRTERIFHNFMSEQALLLVTKAHKGQWPAKIAFQELMRMYRRIGDTASLQKVTRQYNEQFNPVKVDKKWNLKAVSPKDTGIRPLKVGAVLPLSGSGTGAQAGREMLQGIQLAFNSFREFASKREVIPIIKDSQGVAETAVSALRELAEDSHTVISLGPAFSQSFEMASDVANRYSFPVFSPSATADGLSAMSDYMFRNSITGELEAKNIAKLAMEKLDLTRFAIIYPQTRYGKDTAGFLLSEIEKRGGTVVAAEAYEQNQTDFRDQIKNLGGMSDDRLRTIILSAARENPDAIPETLNIILENMYEVDITIPKVENYRHLPLTRKNFRAGLSIDYEAVIVLGRHDKIGLILPELAFYNIRGVTMIAGKGANNPDLPVIAEKYAEGVIFPTGFFAKARSPHVKTFVRNYRLAFHEEPTQLAAQSYDAAMITLSAMAHGYTTRDGIAGYLKNLRFYEGVTGVTSITPTGDADKEMVFLTVKNGEIVEYTPEPKNSQPATTLIQ